MNDLSKMTARVRHPATSDGRDAGGSSGGGVLYITAEVRLSDEGSGSPGTVLNPSHTFENVKAAVDAGIQCVFKARAAENAIYHMPLVGELYDDGSDSYASPTGYVFAFTLNSIPLAVMVTETGWAITV